MNANEIKATARQMTIAALLPTLQENEAVKFADASFAILQVVDGQEVWTEVTVKSKAYKPTKVSPAFDPYEVAAAWEEEKKILKPFNLLTLKPIIYVANVSLLFNFMLIRLNV